MSLFNDIPSREELLSKLKEGVSVWNSWRSKSLTPETYLDLSDVDFRGINLKGANLSRLDLTGACLEEMNLSGANLSFSRLWVIRASRADFSYASFINAKLGGADLSFANLAGAQFNGAEFVAHFDLIWESLLLKGRVNNPAGKALLMGAKMEGADLSFAKIMWDQVKEQAQKGIIGLEKAYLSSIPGFRIPAPEVQQKAAKVTDEWHSSDDLLDGAELPKPALPKETPKSATARPTEVKAALPALRAAVPSLPPQAVPLPKLQEPAPVFSSAVGEKLNLFAAGNPSLLVLVGELFEALKQVEKKGIDKETRSRIRMKLTAIRIAKPDLPSPIITIILEHLGQSKAAWIEELKAFLQTLS